jgi:hypothetical protein
MTLTYGGPSRPHAPLKQCERFSREGTRCTNQTRHADGWCRQDGCDGFRRASTSSAPPPVRDTPRPDATQQQAVATALPPRSALRPTAIRISTAAIDSYRFHHGGSIDSARDELRDMLTTFAETAKLRWARGYLALTQDGYKLVLNADLDVLTGYVTVHRERTWAQCQAGVASRFPGGTEAAKGRLLKEPAEWRPLQCDPATVDITRRACRDYAFRAGLRDQTDAEVEAALRALIAAFGGDAACAVRTDDTVEVTRGDIRLVLSADQARVVRALWPRQPEQAADGAEVGPESAATDEPYGSQP